MFKVANKGSFCFRLFSVQYYAKYYSKRTYPLKWRSIKWHLMNIPQIHFAWSDRLLECRSLADWSTIKSTHVHYLQSTCGIRAICNWVLIQAMCLSNRLWAIGKCHSMDRHFEGYVHDHLFDVWWKLWLI